MGMLKTRSAFGMTQCRLRSPSRLFTVRKLFVFNCAVLLLNLLFYVINSGLYPSTIEVHFLTPLDSEQSALLDRTFQAFTEAMESSNVTYFISGGTLLGSWRNHDRIPWDDDIDVMINASDRQAVSRALRSKVAEDPASFGVYDWAMSGQSYMFQWKFYPRNGQGLFYKNFRTPYIDIFFYLENETHIWNASPFFSGSDIVLKSHVFPLSRRPFGNLIVPAPCNPEACLEVNFDVSVCESRKFSHTFDLPLLFPPTRVPCSRLAHLYPFVHRTNASNKSSEMFVLETLKLRNSTLGRFKARNSC